jgi:hypothetical protein
MFLNNKRSLFTVIFLIILFLYGCNVKDVANTYANELLKYPADLKTRQTEEGFDPEQEIYSYGIDSNNIQDEIYLIYGKIVFTNLDDFKHVFANEQFKKSFLEEHNVELPYSIMMPKIGNDLNSDKTVIFEVFEKGSVEGNIGILAISCMNFESRDISFATSLNKSINTNMDEELKTILKQARGEYFVKEFNGKKIHCFEIAKQSDLVSNLRLLHEEMMLYLWEQDGYIGTLYIYGDYKNEHLKYCDMYEIVIK